VLCDVDKNFFFLIIFISAFSGIVNSQTDTLVLQPGPADGIDVTIQDINPTSNFKTDDDFHANAWTAQGISFIDRGLMEFDLTSIPLNATVISAIENATSASIVNIIAFLFIQTTPLSLL
jgi:hypothetical protein